MKTPLQFSGNRLSEWAACVFKSGTPVVFLADSHEPILPFRSAEELAVDTESGFRLKRKRLLSYRIHFPETRGHVVHRKAALDLMWRNGHAWRHTVDGWGLIQLDLCFHTASCVSCHIFVPSLEGTQKEAASHPDLGPVSLWDWDALATQAGRLIQRLRKMARDR